ncbi:MAG: repeat-containing protein [Gemmatimonadales bacterium]|nr:repeat-containing protein [Gemmatimonadales bacterium]
MPMKRVSVAAAAVVLSLRVQPASAQEHAHPRVAPGDFGTVHFATSCNPEVTPQFDRAVALLHSFEFGASIRTFNEVLAADSTCAMANWGIALSRWSNPMAPGNRSVAQLQQGKLAVDAANRLATHASERERGYIRAVGMLYDDVEHKDQRTRVVAYEHAMNDLAVRQPADTEALIFYAIALAASASPTDKTYVNQLKAGSILEPLWVKMPNHPGLAHYIIHTYDYPALADKARAAAERYASIAPSAAHALHMPSHTFTRVGMWEESANTNIRSMKVAVSTGSIAEALHASDYAMYAYLQMGKYSDAKAILDGLPALAAGFDPNAVTGAAPGSAGVFALAAIPARWVLERRAWSEAAALEPRATAYPYAEAMTYFACALGASHTGDLTKATAAIDSLASIQQRLSAKGEAYWAEQVAIQKLAAQAWVELAGKREAGSAKREGGSGKREADSALVLMREAVTREDATEKSAVTPGPLAPARELLGDMLIELKRPADARAQYRATLMKEPGRRHSLWGAS